MVCHLKGIKKTKSFREKNVEEKIWIEVGGESGENVENETVKNCMIPTLGRC